MIRLNSLLRLAAASLGSLAASLLAQTPAPSAATAPQEPVVVLSPFEVSVEDDDGYQTANAIGATRTNTPLIELPQSIQVFNDQFIRDIAAVDTWEVLQYASNSTGGDRREDTSGGTGTSVRGYNVSRRIDGNDFPFGQTNVEPGLYERIELVKGSSSVLFGSTAPGGVINYVTRKPSLKPQSRLSLRAGSYDFYKAEFDTTGPVRRTERFSLAYRLTGILEDSESVRDFEFKETRNWAAAVEARFRGTTTLRFRFEDYYQDRREAIGAPYLWAPTPVVSNPPGGTPIAAPGIVLNLPASFYRGEPGDHKETEVTRYELTAEHRLNRSWILRAEGSFTDFYTLNRNTPLFAQTTTFPLYTRSTQTSKNGADVLVVNTSVLGDFDLGPSTHRFIAGYSLNDTQAHFRNVTNTLTPGTFNVFAPAYNAVTGPDVLAALTTSDVTNRAFYAQDQAKLLDDRLHLTVGLRRDENESINVNVRNGARTVRDPAKTSPRYSALYRVSSSLSAYYAYNETFQTASQTRGDGTLLDPPTTEINEVGIKFSLLEGKLSGNVAYFDATLGNQLRADPNNGGGALQTSFKSEGFELDFVYRPLRHFQILGGIGVLDTAITVNESNPASVGNQLGTMPDFTASLWARYEVPSGRLKRLAIGAGLTHQAGRYDSDVNLYRLPDYTLGNLLLSYSWSRYSVSLNVSNLFDKHYVAQSNSSRFTIFGEPRRAFATFSARF
jgi:iron complex outermembrane recepter protein